MIKTSCLTAKILPPSSSQRHHDITTASSSQFLTNTIDNGHQTFRFRSDRYPNPIPPPLHPAGRPSPHWLRRFLLRVLAQHPSRSSSPTLNRINHSRTSPSPLKSRKLTPSQCTISYLESCISSGLALANTSGIPKSTPNYTLLLKTSTPCALALGAAYYAVRQMEFVRAWCEGDNWFRPIRETEGYTLKPAGVEEHQCALTCVLTGEGV
ncbi:hypothetical protein L207DRAFT_270867 [Hyaloscypha variabilis F]|uniref:Uncharacterized protein n=1 Tax=Hyaloscypha variabilis (strain UAMH 11265 / GT02V1 / F) TaxID=1149755 RepID=A0A2J6RZY7_HYAVF|nr:hypothetical protein L207DRAFT_270867 [Hyaloscypha variabilis F]